MIVMQASEIELVKRLQSGDESAFDELYHTYYARAIAIANRLTNNQADAQDVVQEAFLQVHKSIQSLQDPQFFYSWLNRIIHSKCVNLFYRNRNENAVDPAKIELKQSYEEKRRYMLPQEENAYTSEQEVLRSILGQMDEKYREVLELAYFKQMKLNEIAAYLELPLGTVKTRCRRAKEELKTRIRVFEEREQRHITFDVDALLPAITIFSFVELRKAFQQKLSDFFMGQAVNIVCVTSFTVLAISGGTMAIYDWNQAKEQAASIQEEPTNTLNETSFIHRDQEYSPKPFGQHPYEDRIVSSSKEAYYICIGWASNLNEMQTKEETEIKEIKGIYEALRQADDQYYQMLKDRGWEEDFLSLSE